MKEHPIPFSEPMVRAILKGRKTQTRRPIKPWKDLPIIGHQAGDIFEVESPEPPERCYIGIPAPFAVGDRLWVRETFATTEQAGEHPSGAQCVYRATDPDWQTMEGWRWRPSNHMPRWASRITLEVTDVRPERVHAIGETDAIAEGLAYLSKDGGRTFKFGIPDRDGWPGTGGWVWRDWETDSRKAFHSLWDSIHGRGPFGWKHNPWVWATTFKVVEP